MSVEALAMAGSNYMESGIIFEKLELFYTWENPPSYLVAEIQSNVAGKIQENEEMVKARTKEWAKAVASMNRSSHLGFGNL